MTILVISNMGAKPSAPLQGTFVDKQVEAISKLLPRVQYFYLKWNGDLLWHKLFKYPFFFLCFIFKYIFSFKRINVIHVHYFYPTIICAVLYKFFRNYKVKIIVTCHGSDVYYHTSPHFIYRQCTKVVDYWLFTSKLLQKKFFKTVHNSQVLSAGYDDTVFFTDREKINKEIDFLLVASLDINKGLDRFFYLVRTFPDKEFALVGQGPLLLEVQRMTKKCSNLQYLGVLNASQLALIYHKSKYLLSLSRNESFGLVITEAAACGVPCIATETDGSIEQLTKGPFIVKQLNQSEMDILRNLEKLIEEVSDLSPEEYNKITLVSALNSKKYCLSHAVNQLVQLYNIFDIKVKERADVQ